MRRSPVWALLTTLALVGSVGLAGCERDKFEEPPLLAKQEAESEAPHTPDCRSWADLDYDSLPALPNGEHVAAFGQVWETVAKKHFDPTLACLDWLKIREQYAAQVAAAGDDTAAAYREINAMLGLLEQSHLHATPPIASTTRERDSGPARVPIAVRWLPESADSRKRVPVVVDPAVDGHDSGIPAGALLTEVAGESITELAEEVAGAVEDRAGRETEAAFMVARAIDATLDCPEGGSKTIGFVDGEGNERDADVACFVPAGDRVSLGNLRNLPTVVEWRMLEGADGSQTEIGYLAFNFWMLPMVERVELGLEELTGQGMRGLIIDLRGNPGGVGAMSIPIARMFVDEPISLGRLQMREFNQEFKVEANPDAFTGPIVVLVDEGTASTSEIFAVGMRDAGRVTIVGGGPSAGMALPSMIETLPDGGLIQYVVGDYHSAKGTAAEGDGVAPEQPVSESRADYLAGRDPVLAAATEAIAEALAASPTSPEPNPKPKPAPEPEPAPEPGQN